MHKDNITESVCIVNNKYVVRVLYDLYDLYVKCNTRIAVLQLLQLF